MSLSCPVGHGAAAAPVLTIGPGQEFLVDEIPAQRCIVGVEGAKEQADAALRVAHSGLECLGDLVEQQAPPRMPDRNGPDPAVADEYTQQRVVGHRLDDRCRVKIGHDYIVHGVR
jgi:hypothetical protein